MNLPITSVTKNAAGGWDFTWAGTTSPYRVVLCGIQIATVSTPAFTWPGGEYGSYPPPIEVVSGTDIALSEQFQPFLIMQWYGDQTLSTYLIQQTTDGINWTTIYKMQEDGSWVFTYQTTILFDGNTYDYRVIGVDSVGNESPTRPYRKYIVAPPPAPDPTLNITYASPNVTIAHI